MKKTLYMLLFAAMSIAVYLLSNKAMAEIDQYFWKELSLNPSVLLAKAGHDFLYHIHINPHDTNIFWKMHSHWILILVFLIEAYFILKVLHYKWYTAVLLSVAVNLFTSIIELMIMNLGVLTPWGYMGIIMLASVFVLTFVLPVFPKNYSAIALMFLFIGSLGLNYRDIMNVPVNHLRFALVFITPLFIGFGFALILQGLILYIIIKKPDWPKAILWGNGISFILLAVVAPFYLPNPYTLYYGALKTYLDNGVSAGDTAKKIIFHFQAYRSTNVELLGLSPMRHKDIFSPGYEEYFIDYSFMHQPYKYDPEIAELVMVDILANYNLSRDDRLYYGNYKKYFEFWAKTWKAIKDNDQNALIDVFPKWDEWYSSTTWRPKYNYGSILDTKAPRFVAKSAIKFMGSTVVLPDRPALSDKEDNRIN